MTRRLLYLNGLAILMIPLQHATGYGLQAMFLWTDQYLPVEVPNYSLIGSFSYHLIIFIRQLSTFSVPAFLIISGFFISFLARGKDANVTWQQVIPRAKVLVYPFVIWTVLRFALLRRLPQSVEDILQPYHFIPLLIQFYLLSPFLVKLAKSHWKLLLVISLILHLGIQFYRYAEDVRWMLPGQDLVLFLTPRWIFYGQQPFWFPFGIVFGLHAAEFSQKLKDYRWPLFVGTLIFFGLMIVEYYVAFSISGEAWMGATFAGANFSGMMRIFYIFFTIMFILSLDEVVLPLPRLVTDLGSKSLGIYMANIPAIYVVAVLMYRLTPKILGIQPLYLGILFAAGVSVPLLLMYLVRRTPLRAYYRHIFG
jgi:surface polysaccharide O-acyltransferase-like enzyme